MRLYEHFGNLWRGSGIVTATGMNTVIGNIAKMIQEDVQEDTPLQRKLTQLGKILGTACLVICAVVLGLGLLRGEDPLSMLMTAVSSGGGRHPGRPAGCCHHCPGTGYAANGQAQCNYEKLHAVETLGVPRLSARIKPAH